ncbi:MAG: VIT1/CCC1 transporter family protein [Burkholderiaceae bacterium]
MRHTERHRADRIGWLRAAVMGANDGIVSTASLMLGVAAAGAQPSAILVAGVAGLVAGAMSMAAGEYVSVSSQSDTETADLARERHELATQDASERRELAAIYETRGLEPALASKVADRLMAHDALAAHAREELGISDLQRARPVQAALASAAAFAMGAALPVVVTALAPPTQLSLWVVSTCLMLLAALGALAARVGGASGLKGAGRVAFWGAAAMALTYAVGKLFDTAV